MYQTVQMLISEKNYPEVFCFAQKNSVLAKNLYNAALFRIRQVFTGWDKQKRSENEEQVFEEIKATLKVYPTLSFKRVLTYHSLEKLMRVTVNPDFFAGLPMQTAQAIVREAVSKFKEWLDSLKQYKKDPSGYTGKPKMPKYIKADKRTFVVTNQDAVLYPLEKEGYCALKLPGFDKNSRIQLAYVSSDSRLKQVSFTPYYGRYLMSFDIEYLVPAFYPDLPNAAGIDFGTDNIAAIACTDGSSVVYKGGAILSENRLFAKRKAEAVSLITQGHAHKHAESVFLSNLSARHACFNKDQMHRISMDIIRYCIDHRVGTLVLGVNKFWKQRSNMGKINNQKFVSIPHNQLRWMISYKAMTAGITVIEQEESYTSKADITAKDFIPVYGKETGRPVFSGRRVERGYYLCSLGYCINADCNGAANILRKTFPDTWDKISDFRFLAMPETIRFHHLYKRTRKCCRLSA